MSGDEQGACHWWRNLDHPYSGITGCTKEANHRGPHVDYLGDEYENTWNTDESVTDDQVEAACEGFYNYKDGVSRWDGIKAVDPAWADKYRARIRFALEAATTQRVLEHADGGPRREVAAVTTEGQWQTMEIERHINCGAAGTPHLEAAYHPNGHIITDRVRVRFVDEARAVEPPRMVADQYSVDSHADKQGVSYADAWRYFERQGYDMSEVNGQYSETEP